MSGWYKNRRGIWEALPRDCREPDNGEEPCERARDHRWSDEARRYLIDTIDRTHRENCTRVAKERRRYHVHDPAAH